MANVYLMCSDHFDWGIYIPDDTSDSPFSILSFYITYLGLALRTPRSGSAKPLDLGVGFQSDSPLVSEAVDNFLS